MEKTETETYTVAELIRNLEMLLYRTPEPEKARTVEVQQWLTGRRRALTTAIKLAKLVTDL